MKVLYIDLDEIVRNDIVWGLVGLGVDVERVNEKAPIHGIDYECAERICKILPRYSLVISQNFSATVAEACHRINVPYISWIYDCPQVAAFRNEARYNECYIFMFDKMGVKRLQESGINKVFHQSLAANVAMASGISISDKDIENYSADLSFVGSIYKSSFYEQLYRGLSEDIKKHFDSIFDRNYCKWMGNSIYDNLTADEIKAIYSVMNKEELNESAIPIGYLIDTLLFTMELAGKERKRLINKSSELCNTALYTYNPEALRNEIRAKAYAPVDSENEAYKVYYSTKINLNVTLHSIETGIPQRVFDIMSVGGFVLSNYQEEIGELFDIDKDIVVFRNIEEYEDKVKYYLSHEDERIKIGINGYLRVRDNYTYPILLEKMIDFVCKDWGI